MSDIPAALPVQPLLNPLTENDRLAIEHVLTQLPVIHDLLRRAEACGLDVADRLAKHEMHTAVAQRLKANFFPDGVPSGSGG